MGRRRWPGGADRGPRWRRGVAGAVVVLAVAAGASSCAGRADRAPGATVPDASTTSTTATDDWTIPETIDAAYVERVLAELDRIDGDAARIIVAEGELVPAAVDRLRAIYGTDELNFQLEAWNELIARRFEGVRQPQGQRRSKVEEVRTASQQCIFTAVTTDFSETASSPPPPRTEFVTLRRLDPSLDSASHNPTGWVIDAVRIPRPGEQATDRCTL